MKKRLILGVAILFPILLTTNIEASTRQVVVVEEITTVMG